MVNEGGLTNTAMLDLVMRHCASRAVNTEPGVFAAAVGSSISPNDVLRRAVPQPARRFPGVRVRIAPNCSQHPADEVRAFVLPPPVNRTEHLEAVEISVGQSRAVRQTDMRVDPIDSSRRVTEKTLRLASTGAWTLSLPVATRDLDAKSVSDVLCKGQPVAP